MLCQLGYSQFLKCKRSVKKCRVWELKMVYILGFFWVDEKSLGMCGIGKIIKFHRNSYFSLSGNKYEVRF